MKTAAEQLSFYAAYHRNRWNRLTHYFGIPSIILAILIPMMWAGVDVGWFRITPALGFVVLVLCYYYVLDWGLATAALLLILPLFLAAQRLGALPLNEGIPAFVCLFVGGWILQFIGHTVFEKRRPAFTDNLIQLLIGPLFFVLELLNALGLRTNLHSQVISTEPRISLQ